MKPRACHLLLFLSFSIFFVSTDAVPNLPSRDSSDVTNNETAEYLDSIIQKHAFMALTKRTKTGVVYRVPLPANLSGIRPSVVRVRSKTLWVHGLTIGSIHIPPKTVTIPPLRRLIVVYQNLGNWSHVYYKVQNHTLATPVLGLSTYDNNGTKVELGMKGNGSIVISFSKALTVNGEGRCMTFGSEGSQRLDDIVKNGTCLSGYTGHYSIVVPERVKPVIPSERRKRRKKKWVVWAVGGGVGVCGLVVLCGVGVGVRKCVKGRRVEEMTRKGEEDEVLDVVWVKGRKMQSASMMRTQPVLEIGFAP